MAGDWIKMRSDLSDDPAVFKIASVLKLDRFSVVGRLHAFWAWADKHAVDGRVDGASSLLVDDVVRGEGFADALVQVGWLLTGEDWLEVPNHDRHNGQSAKERALKNARQARWRQGKDESVDGSSSTDPSTREEKRRREKSKSNTPLPPQGESASATVPGKIGQAPAVPDQPEGQKAKFEQSEGFEAFWEKYPRKTAKANATKAWVKLKPDAELAAKITQSLAKHCLSHEWLKDNGQFIPHPASWLNGRRWEDEVKPAANVHPLHPSKITNLDSIDYTAGMERRPDGSYRI